MEGTYPKITELRDKVLVIKDGIFKEPRNVDELLQKNNKLIEALTKINDSLTGESWRDDIIKKIKETNKNHIQNLKESNMSLTLEFKQRINRAMLVTFSRVIDNLEIMINEPNL